VGIVHIGQVLGDGLSIFADHIVNFLSYLFLDILEMHEEEEDSPENTS